MTMYDTLRQNYYWTNMALQVYQTARDCRDCAQSRGTRYKHQKSMKLFTAPSPLCLLYTSPSPRDS